MKKKYSISFFAAMILSVFMLTVAYHSGYNRLQAQLKQKQMTEEYKNPSTPTEGNAKKSNWFYLKDLNGFIVVYLNDKKTVYEYTSISVDNLPEEIASQIRKGREIETEESLYSFLEGYSS